MVEILLGLLSVLLGCCVWLLKRFATEYFNSKREMMAILKNHLISKLDRIESLLKEVLSARRKRR